MTRFLPSQVPAQITAASRLRKTTCFNIRKNSGKISLTRTCKSDIIGNSLCGHGGIGRRVRFRFLWSQGCAGSSPVARTKRDPVEPVTVRLGYFFTFFSGSSLVNKPNETRTRPRKMPIIKHFGRSDKIETP